MDAWEDQDGRAVIVTGSATVSPLVTFFEAAHWAERVLLVWDTTETCLASWPAKRAFRSRN
jgi:precorrin-6x reductase